MLFVKTWVTCVGAAVVIALDSSVTAQTYYEPVKYQHQLPNGRAVYYGGDDARVLAAGIRAQNYRSALTTRPEAVYTDRVGTVNASLYGYTQADARNEAYANTARYYYKRDLLRASRIDLDGSYVVPASETGANLRMTLRSDRVSKNDLAPRPKAIIILPKRSKAPMVKPVIATGSDANRGSTRSPLAAGNNDKVKAEWREDSKHRAALDEMEGKAPPELTLEDWTNGQPVKLSDLKDKVVLIDFWATWCGPCLAAIPHTNELQAKYKDKGLVIIAVCNSSGAEKMQDVIKERKIEYLTAADVDGKTVEAFKANSFPDYYLIDRAGNLRIADCKNGSVDAAVEALLEEPAETEAAKAVETPR